MNKNVIIAVVAIVVIGAGAYLALGKPASAPEMQVAATSTPATLRELMASSQPQKCTFTSANNTSGTSYVAEGKVRGDFTSIVSGKPVVGHTIVVDNTAYVWAEGMTMGFKNSFDATTSAQTSTQGIGPDERVSYSCTAWTPDENLFVLPSTVEFKAITALQVQAGASAGGASCAQCDLVTDTATKAQCKAALHC